MHACLAPKHVALSSNPSTTKKERKKCLVTSEAVWPAVASQQINY
jgi:hypothetical protein